MRYILEAFLGCLTLKQKKENAPRTTENLLFSSSSARNHVRGKHVIFFSYSGLKKTQITSSDIPHKTNSTEAAKCTSVKILVETHLSQYLAVHILLFQKTLSEYSLSCKKTLQEEELYE